MLLKEINLEVFLPPSKAFSTKALNPQFSFSNDFSLEFRENLKIIFLPLDILGIIYL